MIDTHCHILPDLDDGPRKMETAVEMARIASRDGIRAIIATPHVQVGRGRPVPGPDTIRDRVRELNAALREAEVELTVYPGAEHPLSSELPECLAAGELMTLADGGKHLLVELPFNGYPAFAGQLFFSLQLAGIIPVLAHPERSQAGRSDPELIPSLVRQGALVQLNAESVLGKEGWGVRSAARRLIRDDLAYCIATDAHDLRHRPPLLSPVRRALRRLGGDQVFTRLTVTGPSRFLTGERP